MSGLVWLQLVLPIVGRVAAAGPSCQVMGPEHTAPAPQPGQIRPGLGLAGMLMSGLWGSGRGVGGAAYGGEGGTSCHG